MLFYQQVEVADAIEVYTTDDNDVEQAGAELGQAQLQFC